MNEKLRDARRKLAHDFNEVRSDANSLARLTKERTYRNLLWSDLTVLQNLAKALARDIQAVKDDFEVVESLEN